MLCSHMTRVIIVGAGTFGASLAWWLSGRGDEVVLVDQFEPGDRRATSGGETRLIRCAHGAESDYTAMARRAWTLWRELEQESGVDLLTETGVCWFAHAKNGCRPGYWHGPVESLPPRHVPWPPPHWRLELTLESSRATRDSPHDRAPNDRGCNSASTRPFRLHDLSPIN